MLEALVSLGDITILTAAVGLCKKAFEALKFVKPKLPDAPDPDLEFTADEKDLLKAASGNGFVQLVAFNGFSVIYSGWRLFRERDPAFAVRFVDAFMGLCEKGMLHPQPNGSFLLSGRGFDEARKMVSKPDLVFPPLPFVPKFQREILVNGATTGHIPLTRSTFKNVAESDRLKWMESLEELCGRKLLVSHKDLYSMTSLGFAIAKAISDGMYPGYIQGEDD